MGEQTWPRVREMLEEAVQHGGDGEGYSEGEGSERADGMNEVSEHVPRAWQMVLRDRFNEFKSRFSEQRRYRIESIYMRIWSAVYRRFGNISLLRLFMLGRGYLEEYVPREGDVVIDVGAYTGDTVVIFSKLVGEEGRVIAFEPDTRNFEELVKTIQNLRLKNVIA
jgi:protein-L-isoaspartate O-methyltransferase